MQVVEYFSHLSLECISRRFFFYIQSSVLHRAIWATWSFSHNKEVARLKELKASGEKVALAGDGRYDSVGEDPHRCEGKYNPFSCYRVLCPLLCLFSARSCNQEDNLYLGCL